MLGMEIVHLFEAPSNARNEPAKFSWKYAADGTTPVGATIENLAAFRVGTHTDSLGREHEWTVKDLRAMARNFKKLSESGEFPDVPMRRDHSFSIESVMGYISDARVKGDKLFVDVDVTEPEAAAKYERGTYRSRSAEIGDWTTEAGKTVPNTLYGLAFVDIPAVSRLDHAQTEDGRELILHSLRGAPTPSTGDNPVTYSQEELDAAVAKAVEATTDQLKAEFSKPPAPAHKFRIGGLDTASVEDVQAHIDGLETFRTETVETERKDFVSGLIDANVLPAPQKDVLHELVVDMTPEQFEKYRTSHSAMAPNSLFEKHSDTSGPHNDSKDKGEDPRVGRLAELDALLDMHRRGGAMSDEAIKELASFREADQLRTELKGA